VLIDCIGGFNQRQGEALPPQIFVTFKFVVWAKLQNDENYFHQMSDFKAKNAPNSILAEALPQTPLGELAALPISHLTPSLLRASKQFASPNMYP